MSLVTKKIEIEEDQLTRLKAALKIKSDSEAINFLLKQFDTDLQLTEVTLENAGSFNFDPLDSELQLS